jgi:hypothetical protein
MRARRENQTAVNDKRLKVCWDERCPAMLLSATWFSCDCVEKTAIRLVMQFSII